jgi:hypothetical protein
MAASKSHRNRFHAVERSIRPIALNRKNALFAGSDGGGKNSAIIASLVETSKLCGVDLRSYLAHTLTKIVNGHLNSQIDDLLAGPLRQQSPECPSERCASLLNRLRKPA